ncbi:MAG: hypothetical protein JJU13_08330 [Balneolaceae bacterium]|nr:hypothetical protein [Balneolaceae bacterium]
MMPNNQSLPCFPRTKNPVNLLSGRRWKDLMQAIQKQGGRTGFHHRYYKTDYPTRPQAPWERCCTSKAGPVLIAASQQMAPFCKSRCFRTTPNFNNARRPPLQAKKEKPTSRPPFIAITNRGSPSSKNIAIPH